jgi:hypothetical protein
MNNDLPPPPAAINHPRGIHRVALVHWPTLPGGLGPLTLCRWQRTLRSGELLTQSTTVHCTPLGELLRVLREKGLRVLS